jgi:hypothetical protein
MVFYQCLWKANTSVPSGMSQGWAAVIMRSASGIRRRRSARRAIQGIPNRIVVRKSSRRTFRLFGKSDVGPSQIFPLSL